jgi:hypothetical protein
VGDAFINVFAVRNEFLFRLRPMDIVDITEAAQINAPSFEHGPHDDCSATSASNQRHSKPIIGAQNAAVRCGA